MQLPKPKYISLIILLIIFLYGLNITNAPKNFPVNETFLIDEGESLRNVSLRLEEKHIINSATWFRAYVSFFGKDRKIQLGVYKFDKPLSLGSIARKIYDAGPNEPLIRVTMPEGSTNEEIAQKINEHIRNISRLS